MPSKAKTTRKRKRKPRKKPDTPHEIARKRCAEVVKQRNNARNNLLDFMRFVWWMPDTQPFLVGEHTEAICKRITQAVNDLEQGKSTFLMIAVPFRHGKTDMVSRALPAWFLGRMQDSQPDIIMSGYGTNLVQGFSKKVKSIIGSTKYKLLFGGVELARGSNSVSEWQVKDSSGVVTATGLGGGITGKGGVLITLDDYVKSRAEARSDVYRDKTWDAFTNDLLTRRSPASLVIVCATPWHVDDVRGRIRKAKRDDPLFPQFEELNFPARKIDGSFLFPERFSDEWYRSQYATLGKLASGLMDCEPDLEGGNRFPVGNVVIHDDPADFPTGRYSRGWDLASSAKERDKDDPDWTVGVKGLVKKNTSKIDGDRITRHQIWVRDMAYCQSEAPERDALMRRTAVADGPTVKQCVEAFGGYKDAFTSLKRVLNGVSVVRKSQLPGDKSAKAAPMEPVFEAGEIHILRASWNEFWLKHFREFPDGGHDDAVDATAVMFHDQTKAGSGMVGV